MFGDKREKLIKKLISSGYIHSDEVIEAFRQIPRENFVPEDHKLFSYSDTPLRIGKEQTISAPHMVGMMLELLELEKGDKVLEVGAGSGYHAAMAAHIIGEGGHVYTIEYIEELASRARANIESIGFQNRITVINADGSKGLPEHAPYDRIMVACGAPDVPQPLMDQLKEGGIIILPVGSGYYQKLIRVRKMDGKFIKEDHGGCAFVPMVGEYGV